MTASNPLALILLPGWSGWGAVLAPNPARDIVRRSVQNINADWDAAPRYNFTERDIVVKQGVRTVKTYQVMMIDGSPYNRLTAVN